MRIIFFEVQNWEKESLQKSFPDALLKKEKLTLNNVHEFQEAEIISTFIYSTLNREVLESLPKLKFIATRSTGYDHIDIPYCQKKKIKIANVPEYGCHAVAEHTFVLILALTRKLYPSINQAKQLNFDRESIIGVDLNEKTLGIIGLGKIGQEVLKIAKGFGMKVLVHTRSEKKELAKQWGFNYTDLDPLLKNSDIITLHLPYNKETHHLINKNNILKFKRESYLVNTARGAIIETEAIILGLERNILAGVALDVLEGESELREEIEVLINKNNKGVDFRALLLDHVLLNHPKILITPHNAFNSREALMRISQTTTGNIKDFLRAKPVNLVS